MNDKNEPLSAVNVAPLVMRLRRLNEWRRGADFEQPEPTEIGRDIDVAIDLLVGMSEAIRVTIEENRDLADGIDCTLRHLVIISGDV